MRLLRSFGSVHCGRIFVVRIQARHIITLPNDSFPWPTTPIDPVEESRMYIFGTNGVKAALISKKRSFKHLYVFGNGTSKEQVIQLARRAEIDIIEVENKGVLNNMSGNRPHNGLVLESSELPSVHIQELGSKACNWQPMTTETSHNNLTKPSFLKTTSQGLRCPVYLLLDEITDPQNLGSIIRTAYFMGINGLIMSHRNCAPITSVVVKAASGATEFLPLYQTTSTTSFIQRSQSNGWICCATVGSKDVVGNQRSLPVSRLHSLAHTSPLVLVFGSEGAGLRTLVKGECSKVLTIPAARNVNQAVDSLNVGVAVGIVLAAL